jgi:hypothetical protein
VQNVDQTTPLDSDTHVGGNGGNPAASVTTTESNELVLYFLDYEDRTTTLVYTPNDSSLYWVNNDDAGNTYANQGAVHTQSTASTVSVGGTGTGSGHGPWDLIGVPICFVQNGRSACAPDRQSGRRSECACRPRGPTRSG